ncbi:succinate dehydrogenase hydrophobic membrane anchor subunit [Meiothermus granaticius]|uniref:Succinate dehydrogenase hydrophobic membrane anchor subunit n=1 Tax=Meiothermus granaticius NBRC 107808 TaxID=1227551 RepID=A0A399FAG9_9DEIN|nr:succinate dehydrogenase hydrophobic membrane anchor subunit [Meiothermus granaticius]RIH92259.1 Fumarate reductase subunit D [Meiothermus granaticius NBRC 107808]GEM86469.1 succinate dehydrogenase [Meiothermus granaticius NBRC 107808]
MAIRARRYADAKAQASTNTELLWWVFMRVSGVVMVFLVLGHILMNFVLIDVNTINYQYVAGRLSNTTWKIYDWLILVLAMLHGMNGLRYVMDDWIRDPSRRFVTKAVVYSLAVLVTVVGSFSLLNHDFSKDLSQNTPTQGTMTKP